LAVTQPAAHQQRTQSAADAGHRVEDSQRDRALLVARIDTLPPEARRTLLVASVIGRRFSASVLDGVLESAAAT
jgi:predicted ATPase